MDERTVTSNSEVSSDFSKSDIARVLNCDDEASIVNCLVKISHAGPERAIKQGYAPLVADTLKSPHTKVQCAACEALGCFGHLGAKHAHELVPLFKSSDPIVRYQAARTFCFFPPRGAVLEQAEHLVPLLQDPEDCVKSSAVQALGHLGATQYAAEVANLLTDASSETQGAACRAIAGMGEAGHAQAGEVAKLLASPGACHHAVEALIDMGPAGAAHAGAVAKVLESPDAYTRSAAANAFEHFGKHTVDGGVAGTIAGLLTNGSAGVRACAAIALGYLKATAHADALAKLLDDTEEDTAGDAVAIGGADFRLPLMNRMPKCAALQALGMMGDEKQLIAISNACNDADWEVRIMALDALGLLGPAATPKAKQVGSLCSDEMYPVRQKACETLAIIKDAAALISAVPPMFHDLAPNVRVAAAAAIAALGEDGNAYLGELVKLLRDPVNIVRAEAALSLGHLSGAGGRHCAGILVKMMQTADEDWKVKEAILHALAHMGAYGQAFTEEIESMVASPFPQVAEAAKECLEKLAPPAGVLTAE